MHQCRKIQAQWKISMTVSILKREHYVREVYRGSYYIVCGSKVI